MPAAKFDLAGKFRIEQGATYQVGILYKGTDGLPIDLSTPEGQSTPNWNGNMQVRYRPDSTDILFSINSDVPNDYTNGGLILGPGIKDPTRRTDPTYMADTKNYTANLTIIVPATATSGLTVTAAVYDITLTSKEGLVIRLIEGVVDIDLGVTR